MLSKLKFILAIVSTGLLGAILPPSHSNPNFNNESNYINSLDKLIKKNNSDTYILKDKLDEYIIKGATYSTKFVPLMNDGSDGSDYTSIMANDGKRLLVDAGFDFVNSTANSGIQSIPFFAQTSVNVSGGTESSSGKRVGEGRQMMRGFVAGKVLASTNPGWSEGDLMAAAGVSYIVGRESNERYNETLNGIGPWKALPESPYVVADDPSSGLLPYIESEPPGPSRSGDDRVQAYNFRLCVTRNASKIERSMLVAIAQVLANIKLLPRCPLIPSVGEQRR